MAGVAEDLSKCSIKEVEKPAIDRNGGIPVTRPPLQAPPNIQGVMTAFSVYFASSTFSSFAFFFIASQTCTAGIIFKEWYALCQGLFYFH